MTPMRPTAPARSVRDPGKSRNGEDAMRIILSIHDAFLKIHPSRPATRAKVPTAAVKTHQSVAHTVAVLSTPIRRTGLFRTKNGMMKPMSPSRTAQRPVFVWSDPAIPDATYADLATGGVILESQA